MGHDGPRLNAVWLTKEFVAALTSMELGSGSHSATFCLPKEKAPMKATSYTVNRERCVKDQADVQDESG